MLVPLYMVKNSLLTSKISKLGAQHRYILVCLCGWNLEPLVITTSRRCWLHKSGAVLREETRGPGAPYSSWFIETRFCFFKDTQIGDLCCGPVTDPFFLLQYYCHKTSTFSPNPTMVLSWVFQNGLFGWFGYLGANKGLSMAWPEGVNNTHIKKMQ